MKERERKRERESSGTQSYFHTRPAQSDLEALANGGMRSSSTSTGNIANEGTPAKSKRERERERVQVPNLLHTRPAQTRTRDAGEERRNAVQQYVGDRQHCKGHLPTEREREIERERRE